MPLLVAPAARLTVDGAARRRWRRFSHRVTALIEHWFPDVADRDVFVSGLDRFATAARSAAREAGVPARRVHVESFSA